MHEVLRRSRTSGIVLQMASVDMYPSIPSVTVSKEHHIIYSNNNNENIIKTVGMFYFTCLKVLR